MRMLPWTGEDGQPAYLSTENDDSFVSRLADDLESAQLAMAERTLRGAESAWAGRAPDADLTGMVPHLCDALRDAVRVAGSLRDRLSVPDQDDELTGEADATLARENAPHSTDGPSFDRSPAAVWHGPRVVAYRWPGGDPACVGVARRLLRRHLAQWEMTELADTAELLLSELATNALRHASGPEDRLVETRFERLPDASLRIEVHDADDTEPQCQEPSAESISGRGLLLVDALTGGRWGVSDREGVGKRVWAECGHESSAEASA